jgi:hypothetical protein
LDGDKESLEELTDYLKQKLVQKCLYLCRAYQAASRTMDNGTNWSVCCQMAIDEIVKLEIMTYSGVQTIQGLNQDFRKLDLLPNPRASVKGFIGSNLFAIFPEARTLLMRWAKINLETLNAETTQEYLLEEGIPTSKDTCDTELQKMGSPELNLQQFMLLVGLKKVDITMVWRWLHLLCFSYSTTTKSYDTDGHEKEENVRYHNEFIKRYFRLEFRTYRWVQLTEEEGQSLESLEKKPIPKGLGFNYINCDGHAMLEYHVDSHTQLEEYVDDVNKKLGGNLSIRFPGQNLDDGTYPIRMHAGDGVCQLMLVSQDECIFYQFLFSSKSWHGPSGEHLIPCQKVRERASCTVHLQHGTLDSAMHLPTFSSKR